ncbi:C-terminal binding protein [Amycolatopsis jejuensis]|uniref:C-terminal binding protein n=1 Tax=Amycolatopsis jejuensis TaxID=330084 RepID=UPI0005271A7F|nr:C-terminal binding protein [Amycolatopsis jejuensis]
MTRPLAVFTDLDDLDPAPGIALLEAAGFEAKVAVSARPDDIVRAAEDAVALLVGYATIDAGLLDRLPALKILATMSSGYDMVDLDAARARDLWVCNLPDGCTEEVALHVLALALAMARQLPQGDAVVRSGGWTVDLPRLPLRIGDLTLGVVGMGRIGTRVAEVAAPLFRRVAGCGLQHPGETWPDVADRRDFATLLAESDIVTLHVPLSPETENLISTPELARMRPGGFLINAGRGGLVDHTALLAALDSGRLAGAALDVLPVEPPLPDDPLLTHPRLLFSPHCAFLSGTSRRAYVERPAENVIAWHRTGTPLTPVLEPERTPR